MATMIPADVPGKTPQSERVVFDRIRLDPGTKEWTVLHSVGLARTNRGPYGEIDFVILIPGKGIVCLEVKGGLVQCNNGSWSTQNQATKETKPLKISPYLQAREGMFALKAAIDKKFSQLDPASTCPFSYAVVFPAVSSPPQSPGEEVWETIDIETLRQPISTAILRNIDGARKKLTIPLRSESVSQQTLSKIRQYLRPDFDRIVTRSSTIRRSEEKLTSLTEAQYDYLDVADANDRALVEGAAGTGKTVLAIEYARREAAKDRRVLLMCYNRVLADWLAKQFTPEEKGMITTSSFHAFMHNLIMKSPHSAEFEQECEAADSNRIFEEIYPLFAELALTDCGSIADTLIIDEAQDLIKDNNMPVLNALVRGGLAGGRWAFFGDFTRQAIYSGATGAADVEAIRDLVRSYSSKFSRIPLRVNCRNTKPIGEETALLSGFDSLPYRLAHADGLPVDYRYWKSRSDEQDRLSKCLSSLLQDGVKPEDIVILAPTRFEKSAAGAVKAVDGIPISDLGDIEGEPGRCIVYSTIHSFKGMESPTIVLCGIANIDSDESRALLYVGMSRARSHLILVANEKLRSALPELTRKRLSEGWG